MTQLRTDHAKLDKLYIELMRTIRVRELWPEAFANKCKCSPRLVGTN